MESTTYTTYTTYTIDGKEFELKHHGVKGMKWGRRKARPEPIGVGRRGGQAATDSPEAQAARKEARRQKAIRAAKIGAAVVATGRQMYENATNTRLDRGLAKVVNTGDAIGNTAKRAGANVANAAKRTATKAKNAVLDTVNPLYEYTPKTTTRTYRDSAGMDWTETVTDYHKKKKRR